jgi:hypothetical protein
MKKNDSPSAIERLLAGQEIKKKTLPPLIKTKKFVKSKSEEKKPKVQKDKRTETEPSQLLSELIIDNSRNENIKKQSLFALDIPVNTFNQVFNAASGRNNSTDLSIPLFPKTHFGNPTKSLDIEPKFEIVCGQAPLQSIRDLKKEFGRIRTRNSQKYLTKFEFLADFNKVSNEKTIKRFNSINFIG